jgi:hypothetical protein
MLANSTKSITNWLRKKSLHEGLSCGWRIRKVSKYLEYLETQERKLKIEIL